MDRIDITLALLFGLALGGFLGSVFTPMETTCNHEITNCIILCHDNVCDTLYLANEHSEYHD